MPALNEVEIKLLKEFKESARLLTLNISDEDKIKAILECDEYFKDGKKCLNCAPFKPPKRYYTDRCNYYFFDKISVSLLPFFKLLIKSFFKLFTFKAKNYMGSRETMVESDYARYRQHNIEQLNKYVDVILAVSDRTREIMIEHGVNPEIIKTSYIGTKLLKQS